MTIDYGIIDLPGWNQAYDVLAQIKQILTGVYVLYDKYDKELKIEFNGAKLKIKQTLDISYEPECIPLTLAILNDNTVRVTCNIGDKQYRDKIIKHVNVKQYCNNLLLEYAEQLDDVSVDLLNTIRICTAAANTNAFALQDITLETSSAVEDDIKFYMRRGWYTNQKMCIIENIICRRDEPALRIMIPYDTQLYAKQYNIVDELYRPIVVAKTEEECITILTNYFAI